MIDDILNKNNPFKNVNTEDICIEDNLFDNNDRQNVKNVSKEIIDKVNPINDIISFDDDVSTANYTDIKPFDHDIPMQIDNDFPIETITTKGVIHIPSDDGIAIDAPKKVKIITTNAIQVRIASDEIKNDKNAQIVAKKNLRKYKNLSRKRLLFLSA